MYTIGKIINIIEIVFAILFIVLGANEAIKAKNNTKKNEVNKASFFYYFVDVYSSEILIGEELFEISLCNVQVSS